MLRFLRRTEQPHLERALHRRTDLLALEPPRAPERARARPNEESGTMFETRSELEQLLAVADDGRIVAAAERLAMTQPALTRAIAKLERCAGGALFERLPTGVRLPALGLKPLPLVFGRRRCRTGLVARRSAEDLEPVRLFEDIVRTIAPERPG